MIENKMCMRAIMLISWKYSFCEMFLGTFRSDVYALSIAYKQQLESTIFRLVEFLYYKQYLLKWESSFRQQSEQFIIKYELLALLIS